MKTHRLGFHCSAPRLLALLASSIAALLCVCPCFGAGGESAANNLIVYGPVPGLAASDHYALRVRVAGSDGAWQSVFVLKTACKDFGRFDPARREKIDTEGYCANLSGWSHSYVNFETGVPVEVEIAKIDGGAIRKATVHPKRYGKHVTVREGKAYITLERPCLVAVDINGDMCDQDTTRTPGGGWYTGPPLHAISIFANPILADKPHLGDTTVLAVKPGETPPTDGDWKTLYFLPGVHDVGIGYVPQATRSYYIPGDAIVHGTFSKVQGGRDIRIFGCGTISGQRLPHPERVLKLSFPQTALYSPITIYGCYNCRVEGVTLADPAYWSCCLQIAPQYFDAARPAVVRWAKVLGWRYNSDGFSTQYNSLVEDCFVRTADDTIYPAGLGIRRLVIWHDANGSAFLLTSLAGQKGRPLVVEDCDVIFARQSQYQFSSGSRIFNMRGEGRGEGGRNLIFRNIRVEDPRPTQQAFLLQMATEKPYVWPNPMSRGPGDLVGVVFQNIQIAAPSILGEPNILWGGPECKIRDLTFDNVTIGGKKLISIKDFKTNEYVEDIHFK